MKTSGKNLENRFEKARKKRKSIMGFRKRIKSFLYNQLSLKEMKDFG